MLGAVTSRSQSSNSVYALELGDPDTDLAVATVLMVVGGKLVLLRPRKVRSTQYFRSYVLTFH